MIQLKQCQPNLQQTLGRDPLVRRRNSPGRHLVHPGNNTSVALDGVTFEAGKDYLVPATGGTVTSCGYSGEANPTLQRAYTTAYGRACQGCFGAGISQTGDHEDTVGHPGKSRDFGC